MSKPTGSGHSNPYQQFGNKQVHTGGPGGSPKKNNNTTIIILVIVGVMLFSAICCIVGGAALFLPAVQQARQAARNTMHMNNLREASLAIMTAQSDKGGFPSLYSESGGPAKSSWRVQILKYDPEVSSIHAKYDFQSSWNSPANKNATRRMPEMFGSKVATDSPPDHTHMFWVKLPKNQMPRRMRNITDGTSNTLMLVYLPDKSCHWAEPRDMSPAEIYQSIQSSNSNHPVIGAFYDGTVRRLLPTLSRKEFDAMTTPNGREIPGVF